MKMAMDDEQLLAAVRALRTQGRSPKAIARALGVAPARVAPLVRRVAEEREAAAPRPPRQCMVSPGWSAGLAVPGERGWPDRSNGLGDAVGLAAVLVTQRRRDRDDLQVAGFLVDTYCLGVKDAVGPRTMTPARLRRFIDDFFGAYGDAPVEAPVELAAHLVWGAVEYARGLGFEPHRDLRAAAALLDPLTGPSAIGFGFEGRPFYQQGPFDDPDRILATLERNVGEGNFSFTVRADAGVLAGSRR